MTTRLAPPARRPSSTLVNGQTRLFGIIGHPISQARSPEAITPAMQARGMNAVVVPIDIAPVDLPAIFPALLRVGNLDGLVVTVPHKAAIMPWLDRIGPRAAAAGAASVLARSADGKWLGELFDGAGCCASIENRGVAIAGSVVQLLGAGGAGSAIAMEMLRKGPATLRIHDPDTSRLGRLVERLEEQGAPVKIEAGLDRADILVNASPAGMLAPDDCPVPEAYITPDLVVMDCVMDPDPTCLLRLAQQAGAFTISGWEMFDSQIETVCDFFADVNETAAADVIFPVD